MTINMKHRLLAAVILAATLSACGGGSGGEGVGSIPPPPPPPPLCPPSSMTTSTAIRAGSPIGGVGHPGRVTSVSPGGESGVGAKWPRRRLDGWQTRRPTVRRRGR